MANVATRGAKQDESLVIRITAQDKASLRLAAQRGGTTMSEVVKKALMDARIIDAVYPSF